MEDTRSTASSTDRTTWEHLKQRAGRHNQEIIKVRMCCCRKDLVCSNGNTWRREHQHLTYPLGFSQGLQPQPKLILPAKWHKGQGWFSLSCHAISQRTPVGARTLAETSKSPSTDLHHNNSKKKQNSKFEIHLIQRRDSKSRIQLSHLLLQYHLTLHCFFNKRGIVERVSLCWSLKWKEIPFSHPLKSYFCLTYQQLQPVHETSGAQICTTGCRIHTASYRLFGCHKHAVCGWL